LRLNHRVPGTQLRLLPDAQPLVERLGREFFLSLPTHPGIYLLRDSNDTILYVGKAKNLRQRLNQYRIANPERLPRRLLRLLHQSARIEWQECPDEGSALARERDLLLTLRPRFNRAGVWPASPKFLAWRESDGALEFTIRTEMESNWNCHGPFGASAVPLRHALVRLLWMALHPNRSQASLPAGWFRGPLPECVRLGTQPLPNSRVSEVSTVLCHLFAGNVERFADWLWQGTEFQVFDRRAADADLETVTEFVQGYLKRKGNV
jgi:predicted GIY-YIG superfamily endonuclease